MILEPKIHKNLALAQKNVVTRLEAFVLGDYVWNFRQIRTLHIYIYIYNAFVSYMGIPA